MLGIGEILLKCATRARRIICVGTGGPSSDRPGQARLLWPLFADEEEVRRQNRMRTRGCVRRVLRGDEWLLAMSTEVS